MDPRRYFDHAATTPVDPRVLREMLPFFGEDFGNADSVHAFGRKAAEAVDLARSRVASLLGAEDPSQIIFTSGATESNNWVVSQFPSGAASPFEHSAVREPALRAGWGLLENEGTVLLPPHPPTDLLSIMSVNNETGTLWDLSTFEGWAGQLHSDITQQLGKLPLNVGHLDYASFSSHKIYGPKGIGGLYCREFPPDPFIVGGGQEHGYRAGTTNVAAAVGFGVAASIAEDSLDADLQHAHRLRLTFLEGLGSISDWMVNGGDAISPYIVSVSFRRIEGEILVIEADRDGFAISAGAACSSRSTEPSHVLAALNVPDDYRRGTIRISFGRGNSIESTHQLARTLARTAEKLRTMT